MYFLVCIYSLLDTCWLATIFATKVLKIFTFQHSLFSPEKFKKCVHQTHKWAFRLQDSDKSIFKKTKMCGFVYNLVNTSPIPKNIIILKSLWKYTTFGTFDLFKSQNQLVNEEVMGIFTLKNPCLNRKCGPQTLQVDNVLVANYSNWVMF